MNYEKKPLKALPHHSSFIISLTLDPLQKLFIALRAGGKKGAGELVPELFARHEKPGWTQWGNEIGTSPIFLDNKIANSQNERGDIIPTKKSSRRELIHPSL